MSSRKRSEKITAERDALQKEIAEAKQKSLDKLIAVTKERNEADEKLSEVKHEVMELKAKQIKDESRCGRAKRDMELISSQLKIARERIESLESRNEELESKLSESRKVHEAETRRFQKRKMEIHKDMMEATESANRNVRMLQDTLHEREMDLEAKNVKIEMLQSKISELETPKLQTGMTTKTTIKERSKSRVQVNFVMNQILNDDITLSKWFQDVNSDAADRANEIFEDKDIIRAAARDLISSISTSTTTHRAATKAPPPIKPSSPSSSAALYSMSWFDQKTKK